MDFLRNLWSVISSSGWFQLLPAWLREPPGLYLAGGALILLLLLAIRRLLAGRPPSHGGDDKTAHKQGRRNLRREIRERRRQGDHFGAGQGYEALGKDRAALAAYRRGGCHAAAVDLLVRRGKTAKARAVAENGGEWSLYGELAEADGDLAAAAAAYERDGRDYAAAGCYERAGIRDQAAHCYLRAGMDAKAIELLMEGDGGEAAETLEVAIRFSLQQTVGGPLDPGLEPAVRRCAQLWLEEGEPERGYRLAAETEQWEVAMPIARDHLPPSVEAADGCSRAGFHLAAAEIYRRLGEDRREALERAEHFQKREDAAESARWYESAGEWALAAEQRAASGDTQGAAELFARSGNFQVAADLYEQAGDTDKSRQMLSRAVPLGPPRGGDTAVTPREPKGGPPAVPGAPARWTGDRGPPGPLTDALLATEGPEPARDEDVPGAAAGPSEGARYVLRQEIGRGGMGVVYLADDLLLKRAVAYKVLSPDRLSGGGAQNLLAEARAAARLSHPNIVQVYDAGRDENGFFIVMELVTGDNFAQLLEERKLSVPGAVLVGRQICAALAHAHERRIIHRDLKPSNLIWTPEKRIKLTDFGLARAFEDSQGKVFTRPAGTPYYMAPEQILGEPVDPRTDLYSLGCVIYEMVTRCGPFGGGSSIHHHLSSRPDDPRSLRPEVPEKLAEVILHCLEKEPERRPRSAREVGKALAAVNADLTNGGTSRGFEPERRPVKHPG